MQSVTASDTVKAGTATVGNHTVADRKGGNQTGNFVTGLDNRTWDISDPTYVEGRAATEDQLKKVSDALKASNASATDYRLIANPNNAADGSYKVENNQVDLKVKDEKSSDVKTVTIKDIASKTELDKVKDRSIKYDGNTGHDTVTLEGPNGTKITNLKDGNVATGSKDAVNGGQLHDAKNELNTNINNAKIDLINTGLKFDANVGGVQTNKLGSTVTIQGEGKAADADYSGENIKTFIKQDAATEDQLKKALDTQSANSTDYRLIRNQAAGSNGDYTVDANGDVALTVQDKNHPDQTESVTIKDVASKSKLDKLNDRAVKYDLDPTGNPDKSKVTYEGPAYNNKQCGTHVTNVAYATGNDGSEAVNVDYLNDKIKDSADALTNKGLKFDANQGGKN